MTHANRRIGLLIFVFLFFYFADFAAYGLWRALAISYVVIGVFLVMDRLLHRRAPIIDNGREAVLVLSVLVIFALFKLQDLVFTNLKFYEFLTRVLAPAVVLALLLRFAKGSAANSLFLTRALALFLLLSFSFFVFGTAIFGHAFKLLRHSLWSGYYDYLLYKVSAVRDLGLLGNQAMLAGLSPRSYLFGYQVAGGITLSVCLFFTEGRRWRMLWLFTSLVGLVAMAMLAERSTLPAVITGLFVFYLGSGRIIKHRVLRTSILCGFAIAIMVAFAGAWGNPLSGKESKALAKYMPSGSIMERYAKEDKWARLNMQIAGFTVAAQNPMGLFLQGIREEHWGRSVPRKYQMKPDRFGEYELVHNGYLRIPICYGWLAGLLMLYVLAATLRRIRIIGRRTSGGNYGNAIGAALVALFVQALFHNDSLFSTERITWVVFILLLAWYHHSINQPISVEKGSMLHANR
jgi:hypothetical protein